MIAKRTILALAVVATVGTSSVATTMATAQNSPSAPVDNAAGVPGAPRLEPGDFTHPRGNPYFPLEPGTTTVLRGTDGGVRLVDRVRVTSRARTIQGVPARVVRDVIRRADGSLAERTIDWYATDNSGNVWYLGEATATFDEDGHLESREGSWRAGVDGAVAGLVMPARPRATDAYRQEFLRGHAEDQAWIVGRDATATGPLGTFRRAVRSYEWTRLEPDVLSLKLYAPGVGIVRERDVAGGDEAFSLVSVHRP